MYLRLVLVFSLQVGLGIWFVLRYSHLPKIFFCFCFLFFVLFCFVFVFLFVFVFVCLLVVVVVVGMLLMRKMALGIWFVLKWSYLSTRVFQYVMK